MGFSDPPQFHQLIVAKRYEIECYVITLKIWNPLSAISTIFPPVNHATRQNVMQQSQHGEILSAVFLFDNSLPLNALFNFSSVALVKERERGNKPIVAHRARSKVNCWPARYFTLLRATCGRINNGIISPESLEAWLNPFFAIINERVRLFFHCSAQVKREKNKMMSRWNGRGVAFWFLTFRICATFVSVRERRRCQFGAMIRYWRVMGLRGGCRKCFRLGCFIFCCCPASILSTSKFEAK